MDVWSILCIVALLNMIFLVSALAVDDISSYTLDDYVSSTSSQVQTEEWQKSRVRCGLKRVRGSGKCGNVNLNKYDVSYESLCDDKVASSSASRNDDSNKEKKQRCCGRDVIVAA